MTMTHMLTSWYTSCEGRKKTATAPYAYTHECMPSMAIYSWLNRRGVLGEVWFLLLSLDGCSSVHSFSQRSFLCKILMNVLLLTMAVMKTLLAQTLMEVIVVRATRRSLGTEPTVKVSFVQTLCNNCILFVKLLYPLNFVEIQTKLFLFYFYFYYCSYYLLLLLLSFLLWNIIGDK